MSNYHFCLCTFKLNIYHISSDLEAIIRYIKRQHYADVTEIYNKLNFEKKKRLFKVGHLFVIFILSILSLVWSLADEVR
ncbi:unnamed protein product [Lathyrus oleraceus]